MQLTGVNHLYAGHKTVAPGSGVDFNTNIELLYFVSVYKSYNTKHNNTTNIANSPTKKLKLLSSQKRLLFCILPPEHHAARR